MGLHIASHLKDHASSLDERGLSPEGIGLTLLCGTCPALGVLGWDAPFLEVPTTTTTKVQSIHSPHSECEEIRFCKEKGAEISRLWLLSRLQVFSWPCTQRLPVWRALWKYSSRQCPYGFQFFTSASVWMMFLKSNIQSNSGNRK